MSIPLYTCHHSTHTDHLPTKSRSLLSLRSLRAEESELVITRTQYCVEGTDFRYMKSCPNESIPPIQGLPRPIYLPDQSICICVFCVSGDFRVIFLWACLSDWSWFHEFKHENERCLSISSLSIYNVRKRNMYIRTCQSTSRCTN